MQCPACGIVFSNGPDRCPRCKTSLNTSRKPQFSNSIQTVKPEKTPVADNATAAIPVAKKRSTLIEFPRVARETRPQWRIELSEKVREIREKRSREAAREAEEAARLRKQEAEAQQVAPLGLVSSEAAEMNPIVVAALRRIERAHKSAHQATTVTRSSGGVATAAARAPSVQVRPKVKVSQEVATAPKPAPSKPKESVEQTAERNLVVVPSNTAPSPQKITPKPRHVSETVVDDDAILRLELEALRKLEAESKYDDHASASARLVAGTLDLFVVAFAASPFAAIIELNYSDWSEPWVLGSMAVITVTVMFFYLACAVTLAGRTWGMSLISLQTVDADTGCVPTFAQAATRAALYIFSLCTLGTAVLYALIDPEGRSLPDRLSGTVVIHEQPASSCFPNSRH